MGAAGGGTPGAVVTTGSVSLTAQTADIADTSITISGAGLYLLSYYLLTTTADAAAGTITLILKYTDNVGAREVDSNPVPLSISTGFDAAGPVTMRVSSGSVTYGVVHTASYGAAQYALYLAISKL